MSEEKNTIPEQKAAPEKKTEKKAKKKGLNPVAKWFRELRSELKKVTWPSKSQIINNTWIVMVVTCVAAVAVWGFDVVAGQIIQTLINFLG